MSDEVMTINVDEIKLEIIEMPHKAIFYLQDGTEQIGENCKGEVSWDIGLEGWCCDTCNMTTSVK